MKARILNKCNLIPTKNVLLWKNGAELDRPMPNDLTSQSQLIILEHVGGKDVTNCAASSACDRIASLKIEDATLTLP